VALGLNGLAHLPDIHPEGAHDLVLLAVEEVVQAQQEGPVNAPDTPKLQNDVLAMDDFTSSSDEEAPPPPVPVIPEVVIPNVQNPQNFLVEEVSLEDLIPFEELNQQAPPPAQDLGNIQLGFVQTFVPPVDLMQLPVSVDSKSPCAAALRCWAKYFSAVVRTLPIVPIPTQWVDFLTLMMLKPRTFEWAQQIQSSPAWSVIAKLSEGNLFPFTLPSTVPTVTISDFSCTDPPAITCPDLDDDNDGDPKAPTSVAVETPTPPSIPIPAAPSKAKRGKKPIISDASVRRSARVHAKTKGYKNNQCNYRNCIGCSIDPPTLSVSVVRDLGKSFCNLDPYSMTEEALNKRPAKKAAMERPKKDNKSNRASHNDSKEIPEGNPDEEAPQNKD